MLAGAKSLAAIGEWAADAPQPVLAALGVRRDPLRGAYQPPGEATVRRVLARVDPDALDLVIGRWLADQQPPPTPWSGRRAVAVDGKTLRGTGQHGVGQVHLLAAMDHTDGTVLAQRQVDGAPSEVTGFRPLLAGLDLAGVVVTADALHTRREHAEFLVTGKQAGYLFIVKGNQPALHAQLGTLPLRDIPVLDRTRDHGHGRVEVRTLKVATVAGLGFPHAAQALRITRRVRSAHGQRWRTVAVYAVTSQPGPPRWLRPRALGHRGPAPRPRHHLRRGRLPGPRRHRPQGHGQPAQPRHRHPAPPRRPQHRRRLTPQRSRRHPTPGPPRHHKPMNQTFRHFAEPLHASETCGR